MKSLAVFALLVTVLACFASGLPVVSNQTAPQADEPQTPQQQTDPASLVVSGRQAQAQPAVEDDDDDDEEEDDIGLGVGEEEDDDEDDEEDDDEDDEEEDDDYIERFIEEVLGGEDDDDDDEASAASDAASSSPNVPVAASADKPEIPPVVQADLNEAQSAQSVTTIPEASEETSSYEDDDAPEPQAVQTIPDQAQAQSIASGDTDTNSVELQTPAKPAVQQQTQEPVKEDEDDEDDEDDEAEEDLGVADIVDDEEDDEDDEEEDDEDDDDEDDDVEGIADLATARQARALVQITNSDVSSMYVSKYNRFVDTILSRINKILKEKYDPVTVRLASPTSATANKNTNKNTNKAPSKTKKPAKKKTNKKKGSKKGVTKTVSVSTNTRIQSKKDPSQKVTSEMTKVVLQNSTSQATNAALQELANRLISNEVANLQQAATHRENRATKKSTTRKPPTKTKTPAKKPSATTAAPAKVIKSQTSKKNKSRAKATLYGLSTLKRSGDVSVNMMSDHTTIRTKFNLGPLMLKVEKEFGRSTRKEVRSATATTAEMSGRLSLRVYHGGAASLHSIRVLQPKQMRIESSDDHDRTREFVWKSTSHIAHLVSQKLSSATRSMLQPATPTEFSQIPIPQLTQA